MRIMAALHTVEEWRVTLLNSEAKKLTVDLEATTKALQKLPQPHSQATTDALASVEAVAKTFASPHGDASDALQLVKDTADDLARFAVANTVQGVTAEVDAVIKQLRTVADLMRKAIER